MASELLVELLKSFGLPVALLVVLGWAYYKKDQENKELNTELRELMVEMTSALVGYKGVSDGVKGVLGTIDNRMDKMEAQNAELKILLQSQDRGR